MAAFQITGMDPFYRFSLYLWLLVTDIQPIALWRLRMPFVFLCGWLLLLAVHVSPPLAFVLAAVAAQVLHFWDRMPSLLSQLRGADFAKGRTLVIVAVLFFVFASLQIWWAEPWLVQRLLSLALVFRTGMLVWGIAGDKLVLDAMTPVPQVQNVPLDFRVHLMRLYTLTSVLAIVVNESLMLAETPLGARVATLALLPIVLHYFFEIALRLTCPEFDKD